MRNFMSLTMAFSTELNRKQSNKNYKIISVALQIIWSEFKMPGNMDLCSIFPYAKTGLWVEFEYLPVDNHWRMNTTGNKLRRLFEISAEGEILRREKFS